MILFLSWFVPSLLVFVLIICLMSYMWDFVVDSWVLYQMSRDEDEDEYGRCVACTSDVRHRRADLRAVFLEWDRVTGLLCKEHHPICRDMIGRGLFLNVCNDEDVEEDGAFELRYVIRLS